MWKVWEEMFCCLFLAYGYFIQIAYNIQKREAPAVNSIESPYPPAKMENPDDRVVALPMNVSSRKKSRRIYQPFLDDVPFYKEVAGKSRSVLRGIESSGERHRNWEERWKVERGGKLVRNGQREPRRMELRIWGGARARVDVKHSYKQPSGNHVPKYEVWRNNICE